MTSKLEINIRSLLAHCEEMANENNKDWRLRKYIKSIDTMIEELKEQFNEKCVENTVIDEYRSRSNCLKMLTNFIESPKYERKLKSKSKDFTTNESIMKEVNQIHNSQYHNELRKDLLGKDDMISNLRQRGTQSSSGNDMNKAMKHYNDMQEKIAEDMLSLTKSLKEQTQTANKIIKRDTEVVTNSTKLSDKNFSSLKAESEKLQDHSKRAWKCWMWIMIGIVMMIFIFMVLFMKIMKKKSF